MIDLRQGLPVVRHGDVLELDMADESVTAVLTDPPYGLGKTPDMGELLKYWLDGHGEDPSKGQSGFMNAKWDVVPGPNYWREVFRVTRPGGLLLAFAGTRTADLLSVAIRLAGWEKFDEIDHFGGRISYIFGSGFPKSTDISKAIDKAAGKERKVVGPRIRRGDKKAYPYPETSDYVTMGKQYANRVLTAPATDVAKTWSGWGNAMKPAHEVILCYRRPLEKVSSERIRELTGWDWWHSDTGFKNTPRKRLKILKKYGVRFPSAHVEVDIKKITRKALHKGVESDTLYYAVARRQWRKAPTEPELLARVDVKAYRKWAHKGYGSTALAHGTAALNIDGTRIRNTGKTTARRRNIAIRGGNYKAGRFETDGVMAGGHTGGRWPSNVLLSHAPGCRLVGTKRVKGHKGYPNGPGGKSMQYSDQKSRGQDVRPNEWLGYADADGFESVPDWECEEGCAIRELGEQSGELKSGARKGGDLYKPGRFAGQRGAWGLKVNSACEASSGTAARFFQNFPPAENTCLLARQASGSPPDRRAGPEVPFRYMAKSSRAERDAGLGEFANRYKWNRNSVSRDYEGMGSLSGMSRNNHPCCKPLTLCKYLATLIKPPDAYLDDAVLLVPFAGSGSEMIGAMLAGWRNVIGIEKEPEYVGIGRARIAWWQGAMTSTQLTEPKEIIKAMKKRKSAPLFAMEAAT